MPKKFISKVNLSKLIGRFAAHADVYAPTHLVDELHLAKITADKVNEIEVKKYRAIEPAKGFVFKISEKVSGYFGPNKDLEVEKELILIGIKACDVNAIHIEDRVFGEGDHQDPFYLSRRKKITIISSDCTDCRDSCFCTLVGYKPYPEKHFDLNLSHLPSGHLVEIGSKKGEELVSENSDLFIDAQHIDEEKQAVERKRVTEMVESRNRKFKTKAKLSDIHKINNDPDSKAFRRIAKNCVECLGCNRICPTCTCFLLLDEKAPASSKENYERYKIWDSCLEVAYAKVAGGHNPRARLFERLQNRYNCKFNYSYERLGTYTCVGCGRCIDCCMAKIDMREAFLEQQKEIVSMAKMV